MSDTRSHYLAGDCCMSDRRSHNLAGDCCMFDKRSHNLAGDQELNALVSEPISLTFIIPRMKLSNFSMASEIFGQMASSIDNGSRVCTYPPLVIIYTGTWLIITTIIYINTTHSPQQQQQQYSADGHSCFRVFNSCGFIEQ